MILCFVKNSIVTIDILISFKNIKQNLLPFILFREQVKYKYRDSCEKLVNKEFLFSFFQFLVQIVPCS